MGLFSKREIAKKTSPLCIGFFFERDLAEQNAATHTHICILICVYIYLCIWIYIYIYVYTPFLPGFQNGPSRTECCYLHVLQNLFIQHLIKKEIGKNQNVHVRHANVWTWISRIVCVCTHKHTHKHTHTRVYEYICKTHTHAHIHTHTNTTHTCLRIWGKGGGGAARE